MLAWCLVLFVLGVLAFLDFVFSMGELFRGLNSLMFLLVALGILIRTSTKMRGKEIEEYRKKINALQQENAILREGQRKLEEQFD